MSSKTSSSGRMTTQIKAINEALAIAMEKDPSVLCFGLGVDDPKRIFGSTAGLVEEFGPRRVFDMPTSENGMTGVAIGASLNGFRPVMVHQRLDFFLLAIDQLVNGAAKWHFMFGGQKSVPITIRLIVGHGWGQGPTHSQNLHSWFAHVPGLKVVIPANPADAKGMLLESIFDPNPVVFIEHRWLHNLEGEVPEGDYRIPLGQAKIVRPGTDVTLVGLSYMVVEALHAADLLKQHGISAEVIDLRTVQPIDWKTVKASVEKTGRLIALDSASETCSVAGEVVARVASDCFSSLKCAPQRVTQPDHPSPTSFGLTREFYRRAEDVVLSACKAMSVPPIDVSSITLGRKVPHDVPGDWFKGPF